MEITCDMAMDLAELCICGAASEDSMQAVKSHLRICPECKKFYDDCKKSMKKESGRREQAEDGLFPGEEQMSEGVRKLSKRLRKRRRFTNITNSAVFAVGAVMLTIGVIVFIKKNKRL